MSGVAMVNVNRLINSLNSGEPDDWYNLLAELARSQGVIYSPGTDRWALDPAEKAAPSRPDVEAVFGWQQQG